MKGGGAWYLLHGEVGGRVATENSPGVFYRCAGICSIAGKINGWK